MVNYNLCKFIDKIRFEIGEIARGRCLKLQKTGMAAGLYRPLLVGLLAGAAALLLPLLAMGEGTPEPSAQLLPTSPASVPTPEQPDAGEWDEGQTVRILMESGQTEAMTLAEYLWRVVAAEMPATFEEEALKAQAVCARTYTLWKMEHPVHEGADLCDSSACCQAYTTHEKAEARWGEAAQTYTRRIAAAVKETDGQLLLYDGKPAQAVFFSSSVSSTEDAAEVWGSGLPYLVPVSSPEGEEVPNYHSTVTLTAQELREMVEQSGMGITLTGDPSGWLGDARYNGSGRVAELTVGGVSVSGGAARALFGLRSACFEVREQDGVFTFAVTGYGHGVGMSQYGANAMAKAGSGWEEIVRHYYTGITLQRGL